MSYMLYSLRKRDANVTVVTHKMNEGYYVYSPSGVVFTNIFPRGILDIPNNWFFVDTDNPTVTLAKTILFTSPFEGRFKEYLKNAGVTLKYMPVWTWEDINICRQVCAGTLLFHMRSLFKYIYNPRQELYNGRVSEEEAKELFGRWGGIPRYVLDFAHDVPKQATLDEAIARQSFVKIERFKGATKGKDDVSHKIIHLVVHTKGPMLERYCAYHYDLASSYVQEKFAGKTVAI